MDVPVEQGADQEEAQPEPAYRGNVAGREREPLARHQRCFTLQRVGKLHQEGAGEDPVVARIPDQVAEGHGGIRETVVQDRLELALDELENDHVKSQCLSRRAILGACVE